MNNQSMNRVSCEQMEPHKAVLLYEGAICQEGATALVKQFESLFGYYQYQRVDLQLESPGGSLEAMNYMLRHIEKYEMDGRVIPVRTTFLCASAAAVILAMGQWGQRRVDQSTALLFHTARVGSNLQGLTAADSNSLSQSLVVADQRMVSTLVGRMLREAGSEQGLLQLVRTRWQQVDRDWDRLACALGSLGDEVEGRGRPEWMRALAKLVRPEMPHGKFTSALKKHLYVRMQRDVRMDLREAFISCLVDEIDGILSVQALEQPAFIERTGGQFL